VNERDLQYWRDVVVGFHTYHPFVDVVIGIALVSGGLTLLGVVLRRLSLENPASRFFISLVGSGLILGGIDGLAYSFVGNPPGDEFALLEYTAALAILSFTIVGLPWFLLRITSARKTIESLRGQVADTGRLAEEVRSQQQELSKRYAASSSALARTTAEAFRFAALVRTSPDAVIGVNEDGTIWHWNPAAEELCKRRGDDVIGRSLDIVQVGLSSSLWRETQRIVGLPYLKPHGEAALVTGDGAVVPVSFSVSRLPENSGGGFAIIARNMSDQKAVEERISAALVEKEALLKEVHHRVKNNLQLICSLLRLQSKEAADEAVLRLFRKSEERIRTLALVHERLYRSASLSTIDFGEYLHDLVSQLIRTVNSSPIPIDVEYSVVDLEFPIDTAITCGLIVNELVTNSMKHSKSEHESKKLRVGLERRDDSVVISVWDNGTTTLSPGVVDQSASLGLSLVRTLSRQLGGSVKVTQDGGVQFDVIIPVAALRPKDGASHRVAAYG
jgi:PAS domain S-box-containing protein